MGDAAPAGQDSVDDSVDAGQTSALLHLQPELGNGLGHASARPAWSVQCPSRGDAGHTGRQQLRATGEAWRAVRGDSADQHLELRSHDEAIDVDRCAAFRLTDIDAIVPGKVVAHQHRVNDLLADLPGHLFPRQLAMVGHANNDDHTLAADTGLRQLVQQRRQQAVGGGRAREVVDDDSGALLAPGQLSKAWNANRLRKGCPDPVLANVGAIARGTPFNRPLRRERQRKLTILEPGGPGNADRLLCDYRNHRGPFSPTSGVAACHLSAEQ